MTAEAAATGRHSDQRWAQRILGSHTNLALLSVVIGLVAGLLAGRLPGDSSRIEILIGITTATLSFQVGELVKVAAVTPRLAVLERGLVIPELFSFLERAIEAHEAASSPPSNPRAATFFLESLQTLEIAPQWSEVMAGRCIFDENRELTLITELLDLADSKVEAVAYGDEDFWSRPEGTKYLVTSQQLIDERKGKLKFIRIFVMDEKAIPGQREAVLVQQRDRHIECRILPPGSQSADDREDFVLYDRAAVRYARPVSGTLKRATLSVDQYDLDRYRNRFESMYIRSVPADEYFQSLMPESSATTET